VDAGGGWFRICTFNRGKGENTMSRLLGVLALAGMLCFGIGMTGCTKKTSKKIIPGSGTTITGSSEKTVISSPEETTKKRGSTDMGPELEPKGGTTIKQTPSGGTTIKQTPSGGTTIKKGTAGSTTPIKSSALIPQRDAQFTYGVPCAVNPMLPLLNRGVILRDGLRG
jgi:hypothetical protein